MMLLKIAALGLMSFLVLTEAKHRPDDDDDDFFRYRRFADPLKAAAGLAVGKGLAAGAAGAAGAAAAAGAAGAAVGTAAGAAAGAAASKKLVIGVGGPPAAAPCSCSNPKFDEFLNNLYIFMHTYTSKELFPELKAVGVKFVDYLLDFLVKEKPTEMAAFHSMLETSAQITGNAHKRVGTAAVASAKAAAGVL